MRIETNAVGEQNKLEVSREALKQLARNNAIPMLLAEAIALLERAEAAERRVTAEMDAQGALCALLHEARTEAATLRTKLEKREQLLGEVLEEIDSPDFGGGVSEAIYTRLRRFWKGEAE